MCKSADLLLMVLDATKPFYHKEILTRELEAVGMRINRDPPNIYFKPRKSGGWGWGMVVGGVCLGGGRGVAGGASAEGARGSGHAHQQGPTQNI